MRAGYILDIDEIDRIGDRTIPCPKIEGGGGLNDRVPVAAFFTGVQENTY